MKSKSFAAIALSCLMMSSQIALAQDLASQLIGEWKQTSTAQKYVESSVITRGAQRGIAVFTRDGFFAFNLNRTGFFGSGTFKIEGDVVVLRYEICSVREWVGQERRPTMQVDNKVLTWTSAQLRDPGGKAYHDVHTLERIE